MARSNEDVSVTSPWVARALKQRLKIVPVDDGQSVNILLLVCNR